MTTIPLIPADRSHTGGQQTTITRIVLHATVSPCVAGGARNVARYFQSRSAGGAAHYVVDPREAVQCIPDDVVGFHAPPNTGSIGVELCDPQKGAGSRWQDPDHWLMLEIAAGLVADLCHRHNVPIVYVNTAGLLAGGHGITLHRDVSAAWHKSTHTDPGSDFPIDWFIGQVQQLSAARPKPAPLPARKPAVKPAPKPAAYRWRALPLSVGSKGADVKHLQQRLHLTADGSFGPRTRAAVVAFQKSHHLTADGVVGKITGKAIG